MWLSVLTTVIAILLFLDLTWRLWKRKYQNIAQYSNIPWLGSVPFYYSCPHEIYKIRLEHGRRYNFFYIHWLLGIPVVALGRAEYVESLLASREILKKHLMYDFAKLRNGWARGFCCRTARSGKSVARSSLQPSTSPS